MRWLRDGSFGGQFGVKETFAQCLVVSGDARFCKFSGDVLNVICTGRVGGGEIKRICGMCMDMNRTLFVHVMSEGKNKESNVRGSASFINVKSPDVRVIIDVVGYEKRGLEYAGDVSE